MFFNEENKKIYVLKPIAETEKKRIPEPMSICVNTAMDCLLKSDTDMFKSAETIRDLMLLEGISKNRVAGLLGTNIKTIEDKLKLLELSPRERKYVLALGYSECTVLGFAKLCKNDRKAVLKFCRDNNYNSQKALKYVCAFAKAKKSTVLANTDSVHNNCEKHTVKSKIPMGFLINSIDRVVVLAKKSGFNVEKKSSVIPDGVEVVIKVKEKGKKNPTGTS